METPEEPIQSQCTIHNTTIHQWPTRTVSLVFDAPKEKANSLVCDNTTSLEPSVDHRTPSSLENRVKLNQKTFEKASDNRVGSASIPKRGLLPRTKNEAVSLSSTPGRYSHHSISRVLAPYSIASPTTSQIKSFLKVKHAHRSTDPLGKNDSQGHRACVGIYDTRAPLGPSSARRVPSPIEHSLAEGFERHPSVLRPRSTTTRGFAVSVRQLTRSNEANTKPLPRPSRRLPSADIFGFEAELPRRVNGIEEAHTSSKPPTRLPVVEHIVKPSLLNVALPKRPALSSIAQLSISAVIDTDANGVSNKSGIAVEPFGRKSGNTDIEPIALAEKKTSDRVLISPALSKSTIESHIKSNRCSSSSAEYIEAETHTNRARQLTLESIESKKLAIEAERLAIDTEKLAIGVKKRAERAWRRAKKAEIRDEPDREETANGVSDDTRQLELAGQLLEVGGSVRKLERRNAEIWDIGVVGGRVTAAVSSGRSGRKLR